MFLGAVAAILLMLVSTSRSRTSESSLTFDVASIKRANERAKGEFEISPGGGLTATMWVKFLIQVAFGLPQDRIIGEAAWLDSELYRIVAKPPQEPVSSTGNVERPSEN
jgi:uncharacterized protein (TIGR03435 family)